MKKIVLLKIWKSICLPALLLFASTAFLQAQQPVPQAANSNPPPPYLRFKTIPPFELRGTNGQMISRDQLEKRNGTVIMFFSPDCHHCVAQVEWMKKDISKFDKYNLVLATYQPMETLVEFIRKFQLSEWKNLVIGRDEKFFLPTYFRITNLPFIATYNKKGELLKAFDGNAATELILQSLQ